jgi:hypothetical protein
MCALERKKHSQCASARLCRADQEVKERLVRVGNFDAIALLRILLLM